MVLKIGNALRQGIGTQNIYIIAIERWLRNLKICTKKEDEPVIKTEQFSKILNNYIKK